MATLLGEKYNVVNTDESYDVDKRTKSRVYSVTYYIQGSASEGPPSILSTTGLPKIGTYLTVNTESDTSARCITRRITEHDTNTHIWAVECSFDTKAAITEDDGGSDDTTDPVDLTPKWSWSFETMDEVLTKDPISGKPVINTIGQKLHDLTTPVAIPVLTIERYQTIFDPDVIIAYVNHTNSSKFWGADVGQALMAGIEDNPEDVNGVALRKVTYVIKFNIRPQGWAELVLNNGTMCHKLDPNNADKADQGDYAKKVFPPTDDFGNKSEATLDKDGYELGLGPTSAAHIGTSPTGWPYWVKEDPPPEPTEENGGYLKFNRFEKANFKALELGPW